MGYYLLGLCSISVLSLFRVIVGIMLWIFLVTAVIFVDWRAYAMFESWISEGKEKETKNIGEEN